MQEKGFARSWRQFRLRLENESSSTLGLRAAVALYRAFLALARLALPPWVLWTKLGLIIVAMVSARSSAMRLPAAGRGHRCSKSPYNARHVPAGLISVRFAGYSCDFLCCVYAASAGLNAVPETGSLAFSGIFFYSYTSGSRSPRTWYWDLH